MANEECDYIIAGGGMAGLSLAFYLNESLLRDKKILIIDRDAKTANDHTWCFWEKEKSTFEEIVFHRWKTLWFHGTGGFSKALDAGEYEYKIIRAADFYKFVFNKIHLNPNIEFLQAGIQAIEGDMVQTEKGNFTARKLIFDSSTRSAYDNPQHRNLWQHFLGWQIETEEEAFNPAEPTLFDFRVEQKDECRFVYILPFSPKKALLEFTVFSDNLLPQSEYEANLRKYIAEILKIEKYEIREIERGVIPMSDAPHEECPSPKIIRIGTSAGYVKPSTGYSFQRTQRRLSRLVEELDGQRMKDEGGRMKEKGRDLNPKTENLRPKAEDRHHKIQNPKSKIQNWKSYLDSVLLDVLLEKRHPADDVFTRLFSENETPKVLKFLDEDTSLREDLAIMKTVPLAPFARAAFKVILGKLK